MIQINFKLKIYFALFSLLLFSVYSCSSSSNTEGFNIESGKYQNSEFGFEIDVPKDWYVRSQQELDSMRITMKEETIKRYPKRKEIFKNTDVTIKYLLHTNKYNPSSDIFHSPMIAIIAENIEDAPDIKKGDDYLYYVDKMRQTTGGAELMESKFTLKKFSNNEFYYAKGSEDYIDFTVYQRHYVTIIDKFALGIFVRYFSEEQQKEIEEILESIKFEK